jgi:hypothetical protein
MNGADGCAGRTIGQAISYVDLEQRVPVRHPLRAIRGLVNEALADNRTGSGGSVSADRAAIDRAREAVAGFAVAVVPPHPLERQMMERLNFDPSLRWFVGLGIDDAVWDASTFLKNRERMLDGEIAERFLLAILARPKVERLLSTEHFSVDGTLIEAWCSMKRFRPKGEAEGDEPPAGRPGGRNDEADFRSTSRSDGSHASTTDPDARLYRKSLGAGAKLC